jgi:hypothetical protein
MSCTVAANCNLCGAFPDRSGMGSCQLTGGRCPAATCQDGGQDANSRERERMPRQRYKLPVWCASTCLYMYGSGVHAEYDNRHVNLTPGARYSGGGSFPRFRNKSMSRSRNQQCSTLRRAGTDGRSGLGCSTETGGTGPEPDSQHTDPNGQPGT